MAIAWISEILPVLIGGCICRAETIGVYANRVQRRVIHVGNHSRTKRFAVVVLDAQFPGFLAARGDVVAESFGNNLN